MASNSHIEWTEKTWNPVTGCDKISPGCKNCYAERMAKRLNLMGSRRYKNGFRPTLHEDLIDLPRHWIKPSVIFVNSMSDLFHEDVPLDFIKRVFRTMNDCQSHQFQILTKRAERLADLCNNLDWTQNIWMGVSIESGKYTWRARYLKEVPAYIRFLSIEPLLGPISNLNLTGIHWVIVGGESGPCSRPMEEQWVIDIFRQCKQNKVPFFFKQWGGVQKWKSGRKLFNKTYDEMPELVTH
ncbi:MAG: phage Gp37/Gp68 family protein [Planctomycetes bacterium]|nr:phage Gp37/Gp68 family protein [Planctomycetota bacterium]